MSKRRICVFCETWESGGIESFLTGVLLRQDMAGIEIDLAVSELRESVYTKPLQDHGIRLIPLSGSSRRVSENWARFRRLLRERSYDVVYLNAFQALSLRYGLLARRAGVPVRILHSHNTALRPSLLRPLKLLVHRIARGLYGGTGTEYFACSDEAAAFLFPSRLIRAGRVRFLPNGIETERFRFRSEVRGRLRAELGLEDRFVLGHIGRLCSQKNQLFLLEVLAALLPARPNACFLLVGEGEQLSALEERADELGIRDRVCFCGVTDKPQELLWAMDAFLFPSLFEGLGIALVEAQCAGLPTLCSEHVPGQAVCTELVRSVPLEKGAERWAAAASALRAPADRAVYASAVKEAGFDVKDVSLILRDALTNGHSAGENKNG